MELEDYLPALWRPANKQMLTDIMGREPSKEELDAWIEERAEYCPECGRRFSEEI